MSFKENMIIVVLLRNEGVNKIKVVIYYLNNGLLYGIMYLWILWNCFLSRCKNVVLVFGWFLSIMFILKLYCFVEFFKKYKWVMWRNFI